MKQSLFIDFNGVLSYQYFWNSIYNVKHKLYSRSKELNDYLFIENKEYVKEWMVGKYTSEDVHKKIERDLGIDKDYLFKIFVRDAKRLDVSTKLLSNLKKLKSKYKIILVTDNMDSLSRFTLSSNPNMFSIFDGIFNSFHTGRLKKTDGGIIFKDIANSYKIPLSNSILIDDSNSTCHLFENLGGKSFCVSGEESVGKVLDELYN